MQGRPSIDALPNATRPAPALADSEPRKSDRRGSSIFTRDKVLDSGAQEFEDYDPWLEKEKGNGKIEECESPKVTAIALDEFLSLDIPSRETMLAPWLPRRGLAMIHAPRGLGKTQVAIGTAWAIASGGGFLRWQCDKAWRVLFLDGEMPGADLQARFKSVTAASQFDLADPTYLKIAAADLMPEGLPDLSDPRSQLF